MDPLQAKGIWWLPGERRRKAAGNVTYSPRDGTALEVFGKRLVVNDRSFYVPVIHGDAEVGPVTLLNCIFERWGFHGATENITQQFHVTISLSVPMFARIPSLAGLSFRSSLCVTNDC
jgi:hypothetical protein